MKGRSVGYAIIVLLSLFLSSRAQAGAWNKRDQEALLIATTALSCFTCDRPDQKIERRAYSFYGEYGWSDALTLFGDISWQRASGADDPAYTKRLNPSLKNLTSSHVGAQWQIRREGPWAVALAGQIALGGPSQGQDVFSPGEAAGSYGIKALIGRSLGPKSYGEVQLGYVDAGDQTLRLDLTYGRILDADWRMQVQSFSAVSLARERPGQPNFDAHRFQISVLRDLTKNRVFELGLVYAPATTFTAEERGLRLGVWRSF